MKSTGIVRNLDQLGRIVIPIEMRKQFDLGEKDPVEIYIEDNKIILKKHEPNCVFCGESQNIFSYKGKNICKQCVKNLEDNNISNRK